MTKEATAKFTSRCTACGGTIQPGQKITYNPAVKYSSRHTLCPSTIVTSDVPLNSPGRGALQGRGRGDFFLGEKSEIVRCWAEDSKPSQSELGQAMLATKGAEKGNYITCIGIGAHHVSQDEADDFDLIGTDGDFSAHWSVTKYYRLATDDEAAPVKLRESEAQSKKDEAARAKAAIEQACKDFDVELARLTDGLVRIGCIWELVTTKGNDPYVLSWSQNSNYKKLQETTSTVTGAKAYVFPHGGYDDYRLDMFVDSATAVEAFKLNRAACGKYEPQTPDVAAAWLEKYRGCVGTEYYEWLAQQAEAK